MLDHPRFGASLRQWRNEGAVPRKAKLMAVSGMTMGYMLFWIGAGPGWPLAAFVAVFMLSAAAYVVSRPEPCDDIEAMRKTERPAITGVD